MKILDEFIPYGRHHLDDDDIASVVECMRKGLLTQGPLVSQFETLFAKSVGSKFAVAVNSGTAALHLAYLAVGFGLGQKLLTSPITFVATANAAVYAGGEVCFTSIDPTTANMSPESMEDCLARIKDVSLVVPVHFGGVACDMERIVQMSQEYQVHVIEDASHALGGFYADGSKIGSCKYSKMTTFSFHPVKNITTGEGGMITTNCEKTYSKLLRLRSHGINKLNDRFLSEESAYTNGFINPWYYEMQELGYNYRLTDIQCALGISQLPKLKIFRERKRELAKKYDLLFKDIPGINPLQKKNRDLSAHHLYVVEIPFNRMGISRAKLMSELRRLNIGTQVHYIPIPQQPYYKSIKTYEELSLSATKYYSQALSIPLFYDLTDIQQSYVVESLKRLLLLNP